MAYGSARILVVFDLSLRIFFTPIRMTRDVSPTLGQVSSARTSVIARPALFSTLSRSPVTSAYRGPIAMCFAGEGGDEDEIKETDDEETKKRKSNFKRVKEAREREKARADAAEAEAARLRQEAADRAKKDQEAADAKKAAEEGEKALREQREKELEAEKAKSAAAEAEAARLKAENDVFKKAQEDEIADLLKELPTDKHPPLDDTMSLAQKLSLLRYAKAQIVPPKKKDPVGFGNQGTKEEKQARIRELMALPRRTKEQSEELARLSADAPVPESQPRNTLR